MPCRGLLLAQRRRVAEDAVKRGDVMSTEIPHGARVDLRKQGNMELYTDVGGRRLLPSESPCFALARCDYARRRPS